MRGKLSARHGERGQTIPFWVFTILMSCSLVYFVYNYANTVRYQIRAQNAADSAAVAAIAGDAAKLNSVQTLMLALNVQEFKVRNVISAVPQLLTGGDTNCASVLSSACLSDLTNAATDVTSEVNNLQTLQTTLNTFSGQLTGNNLSNASGTVSSFFANNCVNLSTDCSFKYTTIVTTNSAGLPVVDEYACEIVPTLFQNKYFLQGAPNFYRAIGHTTYALAPLSQNLNAANGFEGLPDSVLSQTFTAFPNVSASTIVGNFAGLNIGTGFYAPQPVQSTRGAVASSSLC